MSKCGRPIYTLYRSPLGTDLLLCNRMGMWWGMHRQKRCLPQKANVWAYRQQWLRFWYETVWGKMPGSTYTLQRTMLGWLVCSYVWKQHVSQSISTSGTLLDYIWMKYIYLIFFQDYHVCNGTCYDHTVPCNGSCQSTDFYMCDSGDQCYRYWDHCDSEEHCDDASDEGGACKAR